MLPSANNNLNFVCIMEIILKCYFTVFIYVAIEVIEQPRMSRTDVGALSCSPPLIYTFIDQPPLLVVSPCSL